MPDFRILTILIVTVVFAVVFEREYLVAEEPDRPFLTRPSASFAASNFTKPTTSSASHDTSSAPIPPKSPEQLRHFRDALSTTPVVPRNTTPPQPYLPQPTQKPVQTATAGNDRLPPVRQVTAIEPATQPVLLVKEPTEIAENTGIDAGIDRTTGNPTETKIDELSNQLSDPLLDKTISSINSKSSINSGKNGNEKRLLDRPKIANAITPLISVFGSLLIVLAAFLILVLLLKKVSPKGNRLLPKEAFEDLGRAMLTQKIQLHLLRLGNRLLLVSITPDGVSPITEMTDPDEVVALLGLCRQLDTHSSTEFFRKTLNSFSTGGVEGGYFGADVAKTNIDNRKTSPRKGRSKQSTLVDLYSEPDESLAEILAKGGQHG
ncbi:MAG: flagellar biosynthetic protein FliO [Planctomycetaceae bacterium]|jgi:flagellar biogenesis protein FliO|nr:flagellar biosynthetic protein FliO [Planctomycetaceae bacterium]